jgi:hypothetical protein
VTDDNKKKYELEDDDQKISSSESSHDYEDRQCAQEAQQPGGAIRFARKRSALKGFRLECNFAHRESIYMIKQDYEDVLAVTAGGVA